MNGQHIQRQEYMDNIVTMSQHCRKGELSIVILKICLCSLPFFPFVGSHENQVATRDLGGKPSEGPFQCLAGEAGNGSECSEWARTVKEWRISGPWIKSQCVLHVFCFCLVWHMMFRTLRTDCDSAGYMALRMHFNCVPSLLNVSSMFRTISQCFLTLTLLLGTGATASFNSAGICG